MKWQKRQWEADDRKVKQKEAARKARIKDQQRYLDEQVARLERLRKQALAAEMREQSAVVATDEVRASLVCEAAASLDAGCGATSVLYARRDRRRSTSGDATLRIAR